MVIFNINFFVLIYVYSWYKNVFYLICKFLLIVSYFIWIYYFEKYDFYGFLIYGNFGSKIGIDVGGFVVIVDSWNFNLDLVCE